MDAEKKLERLPLSRIAEMLQSDREKEIEDYDMLNRKLENKTAECERLKTKIRLLNKEMNDEG